MTEQHPNERPGDQPSPEGATQRFPTSGEEAGTRHVEQPTAPYGAQGTQEPTARHAASDPQPTPQQAVPSQPTAEYAAPGQAAASQADPGQAAPGQAAAGQAPTWGAPAPPRTGPRWTWRKTAATAAVALGIAGVGGAVVYAAAGAAGAETRAGGLRGGGGGFMIKGPGPMMGVLHGEFVVEQDGKYVTQLTQTGEVTQIDDDSVTAKSADGYTKIYVIDGDTTRKAIEQGDKVTIVATVSGDTATADSIVEGDRIMRGGPGGKFHDDDQPGGMPRDGRRGDGDGDEQEAPPPTR